MARKSKALKVQKVGGESLTKREASRMAQNERRKAQRRLARILEKELDEKVSYKNAVSVYEKTIEHSGVSKALYRTIQSLQAEKGGGYAVNLETQSESLSGFTQILFGSEVLNKKTDTTQQRKNKLFERQINQSTMKDGLSALSREESKAFYASTMDLWSGLSNADNRNASIMNKFGVNNLETIYRLLTDEDLDYKSYGFSQTGYKNEDGNIISIEEYETLSALEQSQYEEYSQEFDDWLEDLESSAQLKTRREIVRDELSKISGSKTTGGTTNDAAYNNDDDEKTPETSPEYINHIISRISTALNNA